MKSMDLKKLLSKLKKEKVMSLGELMEFFGNRMELHRSVCKGILQPVSRGFYAAPGLDPFLAVLITVSKFYPEGVISSRTALYIHGLAQDFIESIDVDIESNKFLRNKILNVHRVDSKRIVGIIMLNYHGVIIKIYDLERTLIEAYKLDPAGPDFYRALKRYVNKGNIKPDRIASYDRILKTKVMIHLQQELAND
jgi:predicted transcriptional regulator of viral defense system